MTSATITIARADLTDEVSRRPGNQAAGELIRAGAVFQASPGPTTDVLVRGRPNALQVAGKGGGLKLMEIRRLAEKGHRITIIGEAQFWKLAGGVKPAPRRS